MPNTLADRSTLRRVQTDIAYIFFENISQLLSHCHNANIFVFTQPFHDHADSCTLYINGPPVNKPGEGYKILRGPAVSGTVRRPRDVSGGERTSWGTTLALFPPGRTEGFFWTGTIIPH